MGSLVLHFVMSFIACASFSTVFKAPKSEILFCGLCGGLSWLFYCIFTYVPNQEVLGSFAGAVAATFAARTLSQLRRAPSTIYLIPAILPLVPGGGLYNTVSGILEENMLYSFFMGVKTLKLAGAIAIGIIIVLSLPYSTFYFIDNNKKV